MSNGEVSVVCKLPSALIYSEKSGHPKALLKQENGGQLGSLFRSLNVNKVHTNEDF